MGGDCGALGAARNLGRAGIEVRFLKGPNPIASFSRYAAKVPGWPGAEAPGALDWLEDYAQRADAKGWVIIPAGDSEVRLVTNNHARLSGLFRLTTPPWQVTQYAGDKQLTYARAAELGLAHPRTYRLADRAAAERADLSYPLILKPAMKEGVNALTLAKAWRADDRPQFLALFDEALALSGAGGLIVQELIPDDGTNQFSYCAFCDRGEPLVVMAARRTRQSPRKAGTGTFVETLEPQPFEQDAATLLRSLGYTGLVEIEFMRDPRDGSFRLIDFNPRIWTWHALGTPAGADFALAAFLHANGLPVPRQRAAAGHSWLYLLRDTPSALADIRDGVLSPATYLRQVIGASSRATMAWDDPLPSFMTIPWGVLNRLRR
jgi:predicted ATP-grasp superfamily ATP-dependent carboligase